MQFEYVLKRLDFVIFHKKKFKSKNKFFEPELEIDSKNVYFNT